MGSAPTKRRNRRSLCWCDNDGSKFLFFIFLGTIPQSLLLLLVIWFPCWWRGKITIKLNPFGGGLLLGWYSPFFGEVFWMVSWVLLVDARLSIDSAKCSGCNLHDALSVIGFSLCQLQFAIDSSLVMFCFTLCDKPHLGAFALIICSCLDEKFTLSRLCICCRDLLRRFVGESGVLNYESLIIGCNDPKSWFIRLFFLSRFSFLPMQVRIFIVMCGITLSCGRCDRVILTRLWVRLTCRKFCFWVGIILRSNLSMNRAHYRLGRGNCF